MWFFISSDNKFTSLVQIILIILIVFSLVDFFLSYLINSYSSIVLSHGLYFNYLLFDNSTFNSYFNSFGFPLWGITQFLFYDALIIFFLGLWKSYRTEYDNYPKKLKFTGLLVFFIFAFSIAGSIILSFAGSADNSGQYTMNILIVRLCIAFFVFNVFFSIIVFFRAFFSKN